MNSIFDGHTNERRRASAEAHRDEGPAKKIKKRGAAYNDHPTIGGAQRATVLFQASARIEVWLMPNVVRVFAVLHSVWMQVDTN